MYFKLIFKWGGVESWGLYLSFIIGWLVVDIYVKCGWFCIKFKLIF